VGQKKKQNEVSDSDYDFNPSYNELQNVLIEIYGDAMNTSKKIGTQKIVILKLEAEILKVKKDFESLKNEHTSLVNDHIVNPLIKTPIVDLPKIPIPRDLGKCEAFYKLLEEIVSLKSKIEQASSVPMAFAQQLKNDGSHFKRSF
jgi:hypothetical protein